MKKNSRKIGLILSLCMTAGLLTGCATSAKTNLDSYFTEVQAVLTTWLDSGTNTSNSSDNSVTDKLDTPGDFMLDSEGNYSFTGVENADYYLMYFCSPDASDDMDPFLFSSESLPAVGNGGEIYSGNVNDLISYGYGDYIVKVFAFPNLNDSDHSMSSAAMQTFISTGILDAPQIGYFWNIFIDTIDLQLSNVEQYIYEVYPDYVEVTFTNTQDSNDTVVVTIENPTIEAYSVVSNALTKGETYNITAVSYSSSEYVLNSVSEQTLVADNVTFGSMNVVSSNYYYTDGIARSSYSYPQISENVSLTEDSVLNDGTDAVTFTFTSHPIEANAGSKYSFIVSCDARFAYDNATLELYNDGTFHLETYTEMPPEGPTSIEGKWEENDDGTLSLSYDHDSIVFTTAIE